MIRGTTPTLEFTLPFDISSIAEAWITLTQRDQIIVDKTLKDCKCDGQTLTLKLTQAETLSFDCRCTTEIQIRIRTNEGEALASDIISEYTERILKDGEI